MLCRAKASPSFVFSYFLPLHYSPKHPTLPCDASESLRESGCARKPTGTRRGRPSAPVSLKGSSAEDGKRDLSCDEFDMPRRFNTRWTRKRTLRPETGENRRASSSCSFTKTLRCSATCSELACLAWTRRDRCRHSQKTRLRRRRRKTRRLRRCGARRTRTTKRAMRFRQIRRP